MENRAGTQQELNAIVLGALPYQEDDRLVKLFTLEHGRITGFALKAAKSVKRFGAALEPANFVKAHVTIPRDLESNPEQLWRLQSLELKAHFAHLRKSSASLESAVFALRFVSDLSPEGDVDVPLFKVLGRYLRDSENINFSKYGAWCRAAFWSWYAHHLGFGDLSEAWENNMEEVAPKFWEHWHEVLAQPEPQMGHVFASFEHFQLPTPSNQDELRLYEQWVARTGLHWEYFPKWLQSKTTSYLP